MSFSKDVKRFINKSEEMADKIYRGSALEIFKSIILRTPVDSGRLRGNWQLAINRLPIGESGVVDKSGSSRIKSAASGIARAGISDTLFFTNNLPYAARIENGHSTVKAPAGMVKVTLKEWDQEVKRQAR